VFSLRFRIVARCVWVEAASGRMYAWFEAPGTFPIRAAACRPDGERVFLGSTLGRVLIVLRRLVPGRPFREGALTLAFWGMNLGLGLMIALSLLPIGLLQTAASVEHGLWYARSAEFLQQPLLETLRWLRLVGDSLFLVGAFAFAWFVLGVKTGLSFVPSGRPEAEPPPAEGLGVSARSPG